MCSIQDTAATNVEQLHDGNWRTSCLMTLKQQANHFVNKFKNILVASEIFRALMAIHFWNNNKDLTSYFNPSDKVRKFHGRPYSIFFTSCSSLLLMPLKGSTGLRPSFRTAACWAGICWSGNQEQWLLKTVFQPWPYCLASVPSTSRATWNFKT